MIRYEKERNRKEKEKETVKKRGWIGNWILNEGAKAVSESLKVNTTLTKLNLSGD